MEDKHQHATTRIREIEKKLNKLSYRDANYDSLVNERNNLAVLLESEVGKTEADFRKLIKEPKKLKVETKIIKATKQKKVDRATKYQKKKQEAILVVSDKEEFIRKSLSQKKKLSEIAESLNVSKCVIKEFLGIKKIPYDKLDEHIDNILLWNSQKVPTREIAKRCEVSITSLYNYVKSRDLPFEKNIRGRMAAFGLLEGKLHKVKKMLKNGLQVPEIAFRFGVSHTVFYTYLRENGIFTNDYRK